MQHPHFAAFPKTLSMSSEIIESVLAFELAKEILEEFQSNQMSSLIEAVKCHREAMRDF